MLTLTWSNLGQNLVTYGDRLTDGVNTRITSKTLHMATHVLSHHRDNSSLGTCSCGTTRSVKKCFVLLWWIGVNHQRNVIDVNSTRSDIGCDQCVNFAT
jgi:hypothetical protein